MTVNILGTPYEIIVKKYDEEEEFERRSISGFCDGYAKEIVVCDMSTYKDNTGEVLCVKGGDINELDY